MPKLPVSPPAEKRPHLPVLLREVLEAFQPLALEGIVDCTVGAGGHAAALLATHPNLRYYVGLDRDPHALALAQEYLKPWGSKVFLRQGNFAQLNELWTPLALPPPNALLADLGVSSMQLEEPKRGFSFMREGPLDMRMDPLLPLTAAEILNSWSEGELARLFRDYGEEKQWRAAARAVTTARQAWPLLTTSDLTRALLPLLARRAKKGLHPLTLIFQALRLCVNGELEALELFLPQALELLAPGGRLAIISFHSLEDRIVKNAFRLAASDKWETSGLGGLFRDKIPTARMMHKKVIVAGEEEIAYNPRSRSAKLRFVEKL